MEKKNKLLKIFVILAVSAFFFVPLAVKYMKLNQTNRSLLLQIKTLQDFNDKLRLEKHKLESDLDYVEKVAREKMGIVKKGEIIYKIEKETSQ